MSHRPRAFLLITSLLLGLPVWSVAGDLTEAGSYKIIMSQYHTIEHMLQDNQYGVPVHIKSGNKENSAAGEVFAKISHNFNAVAKSLDSPRHWCDVLLLHINVKGCDSKVNFSETNSSETNNSDKKELSLYVGRRYYQTPDEAHEMHYRFSIVNSSPDYLNVRLDAGSGPLGTTDYVLTFEAIPYDESTSLIRFKYSYHYGFMAKLALDGYLATIGRHKVGFTVTSYDDANKPVYIKGLQGIVERNAMRYFLAIQSYLDAPNLGREQWDIRIQRYNHLASRYGRQFVEIREKEYIATKRKEFRNRVSSSSALLKLE